MKFSIAVFAAVALAGSVTSVNAIERIVRINNYSSFDIVEFYASHRDSRSWEEDILGRNYLPAGNSVNINIDDGSGYCIFDFLVVFEDGLELEKRGNNVCELDEFSYWD